MRRRLGELGWVVGRDVVVEYRYAAEIDHTGEAAAEFARMKVDVILVSGQSEALAAKRATVTIPIVVTAVGDPVGNGLIKSLAHPGGNITGMSLALSETAGKRFNCCVKLFQGQTCRNFWQLGQSVGGYGAECSYSSCARARSRHHYIGGANGRKIAPTIEPLKGNADALYVCADPFTVVQRGEDQRGGACSAAPRNPPPHRISTEQGGLVSYGPDVFDLYRRAIELVDKILRGTKPADLPFEQSTKVELVINLKTAKALGLTVPRRYSRARTR